MADTAEGVTGKSLCTEMDWNLFQAHLYETNNILGSNVSNNNSNNSSKENKTSCSECDCKLDENKMSPKIIISHPLVIKTHVSPVEKVEKGKFFRKFSIRKFKKACKISLQQKIEKYTTYNQENMSAANETSEYLELNNGCLGNGNSEYSNKICKLSSEKKKVSNFCTMSQKEILEVIDLTENESVSADILEKSISELETLETCTMHKSSLNNDNNITMKLKNYTLNKTFSFSDNHNAENSISDYTIINGAQKYEGISKIVEKSRTGIQNNLTSERELLTSSFKDDYRNKTVTEDRLSLDDHYKTEMIISKDIIISGAKKCEGISKIVEKSKTVKQSYPISDKKLPRSHFKVDHMNKTIIEMKLTLDDNHKTENNISSDIINGAKKSERISKIIKEKKLVKRSDSTANRHLQNYGFKNKYQNKTITETKLSLDDNYKTENNVSNYIIDGTEKNKTVNNRSVKQNHSKSNKELLNSSFKDDYRNKTVIKVSKLKKHKQRENDETNCDVLEELKNDNTCTTNTESELKNVRTHPTSNSALQRSSSKDDCRNKQIIECDRLKSDKQIAKNEGNFNALAKIKNGSKCTSSPDKELKNIRICPTGSSKLLHSSFEDHCSNKTVIESIKLKRDREIEKYEGDVHKFKKLKNESSYTSSIDSELESVSLKKLKPDDGCFVTIRTPVENNYLFKKQSKLKYSLRYCRSYR